MTNREIAARPVQRPPARRSPRGSSPSLPARGSAARRRAQPRSRRRRFKKVHRLLRGRYILAFFLALVGAAAGGAAGYLSQKPGYGSTGIISISGVLPSPDHKDAVIQMYAQHMAKQVTWLSSERLLKLAIDRPEFKAVKQFNTADPVREFSENLKVV